MPSRRPLPRNRRASARQQRGAMALLVAISLIVLLAFAGLAIDAGIAYGVKAKLNAAVDAASIAASRAVASGDDDATRQANAIAAGTTFFRANFPAGYLRATPSAPAVTAVHEADGKWRTTVSATATVPTYLMSLLNRDEFTVAASGEAIRRDLDMILVLDTSGSLDPVFSQVKSAAVSFVNHFAAGNGGDRIGLVVFADGAYLSVPINKTATRGFNRSTMISTINGLSSSGWTASGEAMRVGLNELNAIPAALRSSLRVVVFFSDGAPNTVGAVYNRTSGGTVTGTLPSGTGSGNPLLCTSSSSCTVYRHDRRSTSLGTYSNINRLPLTAGTTFNNQPLASFNNRRTFSPALNTANSATRCNTNKAARNMVENLGNDARSQGVWVYTLGLGPQLNGYEGITSCGYNTADYGSNILKRVANAQGVDTWNSTQPTGLYVYAADASQLDSAFATIASEIIRLSR